MNFPLTDLHNDIRISRELKLQLSKVSTRIEGCILYAESVDFLHALHLVSQGRSSEWSTTPPALTYLIPVALIEFRVNTILYIFH